MKIFFFASMKNFFSVSHIAEKYLLSVKRFPVTALLTVGWVALLLIRKLDPIVDIDHSRLDIFLAIGILVSLSAALWLEDIVGYIRQQVITVAITLLWGVYCLYLPDASAFSVTKSIELVVIGASAFLSIFFISFLGRGREVAFWNFSVQVIIQLMLAQFFALVVYVGLCLATLAIVLLFDAKNFAVTAYLYSFLLSCILFPAIYVVANIPDKAAKRSEEISVNKFLKVFALYILTPIVALYALIMYVYLFKVVFTWELPRGMVSYMVSTLAVCGLFIITFLLPVRLEGKNRFIVFLTRYFGLMILPLLTLMAIGIFRRIDDYGVTIHRIYVLLINLWFYGVYIYIVITKAKRVKWIPISFTALALLATFGYFGVPNVTKRLLVADVHKHLENRKIPLYRAKFAELYEMVGGGGERGKVFSKKARSGEALDSIFNKLDSTFSKEAGSYKELENTTSKKLQKEAAWGNIVSKIVYLDERYGRESIQPFFEESVGHILNLDDIIRDLLSYATSKAVQDDVNHCVRFSAKNFRDNEAYNLSGFDKFVSVSCMPGNDSQRNTTEFDCVLKGWQLTIYAPKRSGQAFTLPLREAVARREYSGTIMGFEQELFQYDDYAVIVRHLAGLHYPAADRIDVDNFTGYLFYNHSK